MDGGGLVFNTTYRSLAAEWLGLSPNKIHKKDENFANEEETPLKKSKQDHVTKGHKKHKHDKSKVSSHQEKLKPSVEVGQKLHKKLMKAKKRAHDRDKGDKDDVGNMHMKSDSDDDDEKGKADVVKKSRVELGKDEAKPKSLTLADIKKRLKDPTLSKPARKRLRKKLKALEEKNGEMSSAQTKPIQKVKNNTIQKVKNNMKKHGLSPVSPSQSEAKVKRKEINDFSKSFTGQVFTGQVNNVHSNKKERLNNVMSNKKSRNKKFVKKADSDSSASETDDGRNIVGPAESENSAFFVDKKGTTNDTRTSPSRKKNKRKRSSFSELRYDSETKSSKKFKDKVNRKTNKNASGSENAISVSGHAGDGSAPLKKKRKRPKTRSKQKNIKKDHRPDILKPAHLQGAGMQRVTTKSKTVSHADGDSDS